MYHHHELATFDPKLASKVHELVPGLRGDFSRWGQPCWSFPSWQIASNPRALKLFSESDRAIDRLQAALLSHGFLEPGKILGWEAINPPVCRLPGFFPWERPSWDGDLPEPAGRWEVWRFQEELYGDWEGFLVWHPAGCEGLLLDLDWHGILLEEPSDLDYGENEEGDWTKWTCEEEDKLREFLRSFEPVVEAGRQLSLALA